MKELHLQDNVPQVYVQGSRDFQILCRINDMVTNQMKLDSDLIPYLNSTAKCKNNTLRLLQTKLGYFTKLNYTDDLLRAFLMSFPTAIKNKGTRKSIQWAVNSYMRAKNLNDTVIIDSDPDNKANLIIKVKNKIDNLEHLEEYLSYLVPAGMTYEFKYYVSFSDISTEPNYEDEVSIIYADNKSNAAIRSLGTKNDYDQQEPPVTFGDYPDGTKLTSAEYDEVMTSVGLAGLSGSLDIDNERVITGEKLTENTSTENTTN